jgi:signal peptidase I
MGVRDRSGKRVTVDETAAAAQPARVSVAARAWDWIKSLAFGFVLFLVLRAFVVQTFVITSGSMEGTLLIGDFLVLNKVAYGAPLPGATARLPGYAEPRRGDVVVFEAHHEPLDVVKRIVGVPGDTLRMEARTLYVNGVARDEPYVQRASDGADLTDTRMAWQREYLLAPPEERARYQPTRDNWGPLVVPAGHYFLLGDNRDDSLDSRWWGFLSGSRIKGRVEVVYFSYTPEAGRAFAGVRWNRIGDLVR